MSAPTTADFLAARFRRANDADRIELRTFNPDGTPGPRKWFADPHQAARLAATLPKCLNAFYGVNPRTEGGGKKEHVTAIIGLHADLDFARYPDGEAGAWAALASFPPPPTWVIHSGGGLHAYWDLATPLTDRARFAEAEAALSRLAATLGGDPAVAEAARILRLPGSFNNKPAYDAPRSVTIARHDPAALYTLADLARVLPIPEPQQRSRVAYPQGNRRTGDAPSLDELGAMLRHIDPRPGYHKWLTILASIHSAYPGADGETLCEAWSGHASKPGEIAEKFKSFGNYKGTRGNATIGTVIYEAKQGGYRPPQAADDPRAQPTAARQDGDADKDALIATLRGDIQHLGDQLRARDAEVARLTDRLRFADEEGARAVTRVAELEAECLGLRECLAHPNQTVGGSAPDILAEVQGAYARGETLVIDGTEYARTVATRAARTRSPATLTRALKVIREAGTVRTHVRTEQIETKNYKGPADITYIALPEEARRAAGGGLRLLLPPRPAKKAQGGSRPRIAVPHDAAFPGAPLRRTTETWEKFFSTGDDRLLDSTRVAQHTAYFTAAGEALTREEATRIQDEMGSADAVAPPGDGCRYCGRDRAAGSLYCARHQVGGDGWAAAAAERGYPLDYAAGAG